MRLALFAAARAEHPIAVVELENALLLRSETTFARVQVDGRVVREPSLGRGLPTAKNGTYPHVWRMGGRWPDAAWITFDDHDTNLYWTGTRQYQWRSDRWVIVSRVTSPPAPREILVDQQVLTRGGVRVALGMNVASEELRVMHSKDGSTWDTLPPVPMAKGCHAQPELPPALQLGGLRYNHLALRSLSDLYVAGWADCNSGFLRHFDGKVWRELALPSTASVDSMAIGSDLWIVTGGVQPALWRFDGSTWVPAVLPDQRYVPTFVLLRGQDELWLSATLRDSGTDAIVYTTSGPREAVVLDGERARRP